MSLPLTLIIALGGAFGSIARAAATGALTTLLGTSLPWATIIINIAGSFVIGYAGMLTASDSRFAACPELRAFILVGLCGGFTTFSSFSQQTVDLLRDGRLAAALSNIALSVLLCLLSVAIGYKAAILTRTSSLATRPAQITEDMPILTTLHDPTRAAETLAFTHQLAAWTDKNTTILAIDGPIFDSTEAWDTLLSPKSRTRLLVGRSRWLGAMRDTLQNWADAERNTGHTARWLDIRGDGRAAILEYARQSSIVIMETAPTDSHRHHRRIQAALHHAHRPVLLLPANWPNTQAPLTIGIQPPNPQTEITTPLITTLRHHVRLVPIQPDTPLPTAPEIPLLLLPAQPGV